MLIGLLLLFIIAIMITWSSKKDVPVVPTATSSIVMALGIFIQGAWQQLSGYSPKSIWTSLLVIITVGIWIYLLVSYIGSIRRGRLYQDHLADPVMRFATGTWVAGTSTLLIAIHASFNHFILNEIIRIIAILNIGLWLVVLYVMCRGWYQILHQSQIHRVHGIILLSTVSTQSIVLLLHQIFKIDNLLWLHQTLIIVGLIFYIWSVVLIVYRYWQHRHPIVEDWTDPNCILYGALAITGAAVQTVHAWSDGAIIYLWWITWIILIIVEGIEVVRAIKRIQAKGWRQGIGIYNTAQWTRLFTLGMFYFFTLRIYPLYQQYTESRWALEMYRWILTGGSWIISILLVIEIGLAVQALWHHAQRKRAKTSNMP